MDTTPPLEATFSLTYRERVSAAWALTLGTPVTLIPLSFFPLAGAALLAIKWLTPSPASLMDILVIALSFAFVPGVFFLNAYNAHRADRNKGPYTYRFDQSGLQCVSSIAEMKQSWAAIPRARERVGILFLYFNKRCAHCIPVRAFANPDVANSVMQLAAAGGVPRVGT
jgi:hypothetical protein